jgi:hypothetical protein
MTQDERRHVCRSCASLLDQMRDMPLWARLPFESNARCTLIWCSCPKILGLARSLPTPSKISKPPSAHPSIAASAPQLPRMPLWPPAVLDLGAKACHHLDPTPGARHCPWPPRRPLPRPRLPSFPDSTAATYVRPSMPLPAYPALAPALNSIQKVSSSTRCRWLPPPFVHRNADWFIQIVMFGSYRLVVCDVHKNAMQIDHHWTLCCYNNCFRNIDQFEFRNQ